jgi:hypothetical protein
MGSACTPSNNILVLILSCEKTRDRREACLETWLRHIPPGIIYKFVIGRPGKAAVTADDYLYVDAPDTYLGLPEKVWQMCQQALMHWDFEWLFKTDDDSFVNLLRVWEYPKSRDYMGRKITLTQGAYEWHRKVVPGKEMVGLDDNGKIPAAEVERMDKLAALPNPTRHATSWASGMGYFLSRNAVRKVAQEPYLHVQKELYEDRMVGCIMASWGIYLHGQHQTLRYANEGIYGATAIHPCLPDRMREVYWQLLRAGEMET